MSKTIIIILIVLSIITIVIPFLGAKSRRAIIKQIWMTIAFATFVLISFLMVKYSDSFNEIEARGYMSLFLFIALVHAMGGFVFSFMNYAIHKTGLTLLCSVLYLTPLIVALVSFLME